jgi:hypothetical protein
MIPIVVAVAITCSTAALRPRRYHSPYLHRRESFISHTSFAHCQQELQVRVLDLKFWRRRWSRCCFLFLTPNGLAGRYQHFGAVYCLHLHYSKALQPRRPTWTTNVLFFGVMPHSKFWKVNILVFIYQGYRPITNQTASLFRLTC